MRLSQSGRPGVRDETQSPVIWRCTGCGALVHPAEPHAPVAWCRRCGRMVGAVRDGGEG
ncbi:MAG TPA: hypothetical protein VMB72_05255 [Acidimicrobiales bacterium]|nr:hypothetical protein [Acidimicrobiales bacterium]